MLRFKEAILGLTNSLARIFKLGDKVPDIAGNQIITDAIGSGDNKLNIEELRAKGDIKGLLWARMHPTGPEMYKAAGDALKGFRSQQLTAMAKKYLKDKDSAVRLRAVSFLSEWGGESAVPELIKALHNEDDGVQMDAAKALGMSRDKQAIQPIIDAVEHFHLRHYSASEALRAIDSFDATTILLQKLENSFTHRGDWAQMLVNLGDLRAVPLLKKFLQHGEFDSFENSQIRKFVEAHPELHPQQERMKCLVCHNERPITEMLGGGDKWFCRGQCWRKRGTILPSGIGKDCPLYTEGLCTAGGVENLCSLQQGHFSTDCKVYAIYR